MGAPAQTQGARVDVTSIVGGRTPYSILVAGADRHPERELLVYEDDRGGVRSYSWADLARETSRASTRLAEQGVGQGDRVLVHLSNRPEFLFIWFAVARLGAVMVPTNLASSPNELAFIAGHSQAALAVGEHHGFADLWAAAALLDDPLRLLDWDEPAASQENAGPEAEPDPLRDLAVMYTSGTTARPKGVRVTAGNYVFAGEVYAAAMRVQPSDRVLAVLPLFHANAQYYTAMGALVSGATLLLMPRFSASRWPGQVMRHRATLANLFAAPLRMILAHGSLAGFTPGDLRAVMFAQNLTEAEVERWDELTGVPLVQGYGMTETIGPPLMNSLGQPRRPSSIGRPTLGYRVRVVGPDGASVVRAQPGQLLVAGEPGVSLMAGYLDDPEATAAAVQDGWLHTGDIVRVDADGLYTFVDRDKDMIKRAGENVAASEVEAVLLDHPAVTDAAVFGVPDEIRDERIVACVVAADGAAPDLLLDWCRERLASFRVPEDVLVLGELPRTSVGKVQKHVLRTRYLGEGDRLGLDGRRPLL